MTGLDEGASPRDDARPPGDSMIRRVLPFVIVAACNPGEPSSDDTDTDDAPACDYERPERPAPGELKAGVARVRVPARARLRARLEAGGDWLRARRGSARRYPGQEADRIADRHEQAARPRRCGRRQHCVQARANLRQAGGDGKVARVGISAQHRDVRIGLHERAFAGPGLRGVENGEGAAFPQAGCGGRAWSAGGGRARARADRTGCDAPRCVEPVRPHRACIRPRRV